MLDKFEKHRVNNDLRVVTVPMKGAKAVTVLVLVGAGSKYENKNNNGISHFLEHMFFKGTKKRPSTLEIAETLDKIGGEFNAFTGKEYTGYWAKVDSSHLNLALDWVSDIFLNSQIDPKEIEREKGVIVEELNMYLDTPMKYISDVWEKLLYGDQAAGWSIIGDKEVVKKMKRSQFIDYLNNHYLSQNVVVIVAGDVKQKNLKSQVKNYFKTIATGKPKSKKKVTEKQKKPKALIHYKKTDQAHFCLGVRGCDIFDSQKYAMNLLSVILGGSMSSRLWISLRERRGLGYYVRTSPEFYTDTGYLVTQAGINNQQVKKAIKLVLEEYKKIGEKGVSEPELKKAKDYLRGKTILNLEASDTTALFFGRQEVLTNKILTPEEKFDKIYSVQVKDINKLAKQIFRPEKLNLALIGPFKQKKEFQNLLKV